MCAKNNNNLFAGLSNNGASKLMLAAIFAGTLPVAAAEFAPTLGADSAYDITPVSQEQATEDSIVTYTYEKGEIVPHYYNIQVKENVTGSTTRFQNEDFYDANADGQADDITGNFSGNTQSGTNALGGAVFNSNEVGNINGHYINNTATTSSNYAGGGAIINYKDKNNSSIQNIMGDITGDFIGNRAVSTNTSSNIDNNFATGGAIFNDDYGTIGNIKGDFIRNNVTSTLGIAGGGAINNNAGAVINSITGNFIENTATPLNVYGSGGAIFNSADRETIPAGYIGSISGNFINNGVTAASTVAQYYPFAQGGAISNDGSMGSIDGYFSGNYVISNLSQAVGGAICSLGTVDSISGTFINNYAVSGQDSSIGGALSIKQDTQSIKGDFIGNYAESSGGAAQGGAVVIVGNLDNLEGNFYGNYAKANNTAQASAGAIHNTGNIIDIKANFVSNYAESVDNNSGGGAIYNVGTIENLTGDFTGNYVYGKNTGGAGGAVWNTTGAEITFTNSNFHNNYVKTDNPEINIRGGAIYNAGEVNINAVNGKSEFRGNKTIQGEKSEQNAIYSGSSGVVTLNAEEGGEVIFYDEITGGEGHKLNVTGDESGVITINNNIKNADINNTSYAMNIAEGSYLNNNNSFAMNGGVVNIGHLGLTPVSFRNFDMVSGEINIASVDVDLANQKMGRFTAETYTNVGDAKINILGMNLLSDAPSDRAVTAMYFAEPEIKENVSTREFNLPDGGQTTIYAPIYKYNLTYDTENEYNGKGDGGYFLFTRGDKIIYPDGGGGSTGNDSDAFNPAVLATPVGNLAAGQAAVNEAFKYVFEHADAFTQLPAMERYAKINANKYALSTDFNDNMPSYAEQLHNNAVWFRPYTTFESMNLDNGPDVDAITYGSLVGFDGDFKEMKNGWHRVFTGYAGYMGSSLNYSGVDTSMNGGLLGFTETFYKGNFWTAITASAGASVGESHTMYGKEDYTSLLAGVGSKTGYNFEFKDGKFIIQPIMYLSYTFVNTFDYKNAAGVNIESDPLHTIQLNPSVRFIANLKGGWQPYASVGMVWNLMNESKVTANNVKLPEMSVKPYVEYGVGVQRNWADKFTAFLQAMIRNGGRNGIALTGGFRFMLGSDDDNNDKPKVKKEIKSL